MVNSARVRVNLPDNGDCWFFIQPEDSIDEFCAKVKAEDPMINTLEVLKGKSSKIEVCDGQESLFESLKGSKKPMYLRLNDILYRFGNPEDESKIVSGTATTKTNSDVGSFDLKETSPLFNQCKKLGLSNYQSSTIATLMRQVAVNEHHKSCYKHSFIDRIFVSIIHPKNIIFLYIICNL